MGPDPYFLTTPRLRMRLVAPSDLEPMTALHGDPEVMRYIGPPDGRDKLRDQVLPRWAALAARFPGCGFFAAEPVAGGEFLGWFHLKPNGEDPSDLDLGYRLVRAAWGQGYATEGTRALVAYAFATLRARRLTAHALESNQGSRHVLEKSGFQFAGFYQEARFPGGATAVRYELTAPCAQPGADGRT